MLGLFPTPVLPFENKVDTSFETDLVSYLLEQEKNKTETESYSLKGKTGWHSKDNLCKLETEWSKKLTKMIYDVTDHYSKTVFNEKLPDLKYLEIICWSMFMRAGDYSSLHTHPNTDFSGCYYLKVPNGLPKEEGKLVLVDPRGGARGSRTMSSQAFYYQPVKSKGIIFPPWLEHYVEPHYTDDLRISIAFNVKVLDTYFLEKNK
jgi:uncharacterized protein (TIGR02466 family)